MKDMSMAIHKQSMNRALITLLMSAALLSLILYYRYLLYPHYKQCLVTGTDKGVCVHTWLFRI